MDILSSIIRSDRLDLILLKADVLHDSLMGDVAAAQSYLGVDLPAEWFQEKELIDLRYQQTLRDPEYQPWSLRAIVLREMRQMIGYIGFHTQPAASYLHAFAPNGVEFGYTIFPAFRRNGYAREASLALVKWAYEQHSVSEFILSISPDNVPSLKLAQALSFAKIGSHIDEEDGIEDIYRLDYHPG